MFLFGLVTICQGLVQGFGGIVTTRFFLGVFEAGMFPGKHSTSTEESPSV
jgi:peroxin-3